MRNIRIVRALKIVLLVVIACAVFGFIVMSLWNWLMPALFGWHPIGFWQALGIFVLSKILFGGFRGGWGHGRHWRRRMMERWEQMSPEEREKFRKGLQGCCGEFRTRSETARGAADQAPPAAAKP
jgi:hypothetical protein